MRETWRRGKFCRSAAHWLNRNTYPVDGHAIPTWDSAETTTHTRLVGSRAFTRATMVPQLTAVATLVPPYLSTTHGPPGENDICARWVGVRGRRCGTRTTPPPTKFARSSACGGINAWLLRTAACLRVQTVGALQRWAARSDLDIARY